jgi:diguanylate cyclase (GGDEF)-like protein
MITGCLVGYGSGIGARSVQVVICWLLLTGLHVGLALAAGSVCRLPAQSTATRRVWGAVAFVAGTYIIGDVAQLILIVADPRPLAAALGGTVQTTSVVVGTVALVAAMITAPLGLASRREAARFWLDVATVMIAATTVGCYASNLSAPANLPGLLTQLLMAPGVFLVGAFAAAKMMLIGRPPFTACAGALVMAAAVAEGATQASGDSLVRHGRLSWVLGATVIANALLTGAARVQHRSMLADARAVPAPRRRRFTLLPYAAVAAIYVLLVSVLVQVGLNPRTWIVIAGAIASTSVVVGRQVAALVENGRLVDDLDHKVHQLNESLAERDRLAAELRHQAYHDPLTGLANRAMFHRRLRAALDRHHAAAGLIALLIVDLDDFKPVNDRYGHLAGDELLTAMGRRLLACVRDGDLVARLGGDEFAVLVEGLDGNELDGLARRIVERAAAPFPLTEGTVSVGVSIGVAIADAGPVPGMCSADQLIHDADTAMYASKRAGKGNYRLGPSLAQSRSAA